MRSRARSPPLFCGEEGWRTDHEILSSPKHRFRSPPLPIAEDPSTTLPVNQVAIEQLRQRVVEDRDLQERLRAIVDHAAFVSSVLEVAHELGLDLTAGELEQEMRNSQQAWMLRWL